MPDISFEKHRARNVPKDFNALLKRQRELIASTVPRRFVEPPRRYEKFRDTIDLLYILGASDEQVERLHFAFEDIEARYLVLAKTLDRSVPPTPIKRAMVQISKALQRGAEALEDADRDAVVRQYLGVENGSELPSTREAFEEANTLAERAAIITAQVRELQADFKQYARFFDYKSGLTPRGKSTQFSLAFAVGALADLFEEENEKGRRASVNQNVAPQGAENANSAFHFTGDFIPFVETYLATVDDGLYWFAPGDYFTERLNKLLKARRRDPNMHKLMLGDVSVKDTLDFMARVEKSRAS